MKYFVVVSVFCFVSTLANGATTGKDSDSSSSSEEMIRELAKDLKDKFNVTVLFDVIKMTEKVKEKCPDIESKIEVTMDKVGACIDEIELGSDTFCSLIRKNFATCAKPVRELIISCMPDESKDIPPMAEKIILAVIDRACSSTVEEMLELFNPCLFDKKPSEFKICEDARSVAEQHKDKLLTKSVICQILPKARNCERSVVESSCKNTVTIEAHKKMTGAVEKSVKEECDAVNKV